MVEDNILDIFSADPEKCFRLCEINQRCGFWRARWDGSQCFLFIGDYQHVSLKFLRYLFLNFHKTLHIKSCGSFAGPINWVDCNEGPESCYAYLEDDCVYTGERIGKFGTY